MKLSQDAGTQYVGMNHFESFAEFRTKIIENFNERTKGKTLFFVRPTYGTLEQTYLDGFLIQDRQQFNCNACKSFLKKVGNVVFLNDMGVYESALWGGDQVYGQYQTAVNSLRMAVERSVKGIQGVYLNNEVRVGHKEQGGFNHFYVDLPQNAVFNTPLLSAGQRAAELQQEFGIVSKNINRINYQVVQKSLQLLRSGKVKRAEKALPSVEWLYKLIQQLDNNRRGIRNNLIWQAVATAPKGFAKITTNVASTLLKSIADGESDYEAIAKYEHKTNELTYQRAQAPAKEGTIDRAEKIFATLGAELSIERSFAKIEHIERVWQPNEPEFFQRPTPSQTGLFGQQRKNMNQAPQDENITPTNISLTRFLRKVAPDANSMELYVPNGKANFGAIMTATYAHAPCLFKWDNHFSQYVYHNGSGAYDWHLYANQWTDVMGLSFKPCMWDGGKVLPNERESIMFILEGARDRRPSGLAIFPSTLKPEYHEVRSVIENHSNSNKPSGEHTATACGLLLTEGSNQTIKVKVVANGITNIYNIHGWD